MAIHHYSNRSMDEEVRIYLRLLEHIYRSNEYEAKRQEELKKSSLQNLQSESQSEDK